MSILEQKPVSIRASPKADICFRRQNGRNVSALKRPKIGA